MSKQFQVDYSQLDTKLHKKAYKLSEVKDQIEKLSFDIVRFKDQDKSADLWQVQADDNGEYIVALYQADEEPVKNAWEVSVNKMAGDLQVCYKGDPIVRLASHQLGIPRSELDKVPGYLPSKLASNKKLVASLLAQLPVSAKNEVLKRYPELI